MHIASISNMIEFGMHFLGYALSVFGKESKISGDIDTLLVSSWRSPITKWTLTSNTISNNQSDTILYLTILLIVQ